MLVKYLYGIRSASSKYSSLVYLGSPVLFKGRRPPSLFLAGGGSELEGLEEEDGRAARSWGARALGSPDLKFETEEEKEKNTFSYWTLRRKEEEHWPAEGWTSWARCLEVWTRTSASWAISWNPSSLFAHPIHILHSIYDHMSFDNSTTLNYYGPHLMRYSYFIIALWRENPICII